MVQGYKCDRCDDFENGEPAASLSTQSDVYDLCPGCRDDAIDWVVSGAGSSMQNYGGSSD